MLQALLLRLTDQGVQYLEATVTPSNSASARMFRSLAERLGAACGESVIYEESLFPSDKHEEERLLRIGPIDANVLRAGGNQMALPGSGLEE